MRAGVLKLVLVFLLVTATVAGCAHLPPVPLDQRNTGQDGNGGGGGGY